MLLVLLLLVAAGEGVEQAPADGAKRGLVAPKFRGEQAAARRSRRRSQVGKGGLNIVSLVILALIIYCAFNRSRKNAGLPDAQPFIRERPKKKNEAVGKSDDIDESVL
jgi:hypothetical protein